jgi:phosphatidate cytidylyltransferase
MNHAPDHHQMTRTSALFSELKPRLLSGLLLAAVALGLCYLGPLSFAFLVVIVALIMCWEWGRVVRGREFDAAFIVHGGAVTAASLLAALGLAALGLLVVMIGAVLVLLIQYSARGRLSALGVPYVGVPAISLLWIRWDEPFGFAAVLFVLLVVCATDTFAYFGGRGIGGARLWPRVSPNKTWAGLISGVAAGTIVGALFAFFVEDSSHVGLALLAFLLALVSQVGDLTESAIKRGCGVKDASTLIPGHGGFLDRMDGVVFAAFAAAIIALLIDPYAPARALLLGS